MSKRKHKLEKPTGIMGQTRIEAGPGGTTSEFQRLVFPRTKEEIEEFIVRGFLRAARKQGLLHTDVIDTAQNELDDFDFCLKTLQGEKSLELMEIAPLENVSRLPR